VRKVTQGFGTAGRKRVVPAKLQTAKPRRNSAIPRRDAPGLCLIRPPMRAWGMPGAQCTRSLVCAWCSKYAHEYSQRSHRKSPGIPARNGFNGFLRALPGDRAFLSPSLPDKKPIRARLGRSAIRQFDAGVEASGPHEFTVRNRVCRPRAV